MNGPQGYKTALCPSEAHFIFCSVTPGTKQSSGNRPYVNNTWSAPFQKDKSRWSALYQSNPSQLLWHVRGGNSVGIVLLVCKGLIRGAFTPLQKIWHWLFRLAWHIACNDMAQNLTHYLNPRSSWEKLEQCVPAPKAPGFIHSMGSNLVYATSLSLLIADFPTDVYPLLYHCGNL